MRLTSMLSVVIVTAAIAACTEDPLGPPDEAPDVQGTVMDPDYGLLLAPSAAFGIYPDTFFVTGREIVVLEADGSYRRGTAADASKGDVVRAWLTGMRLDSYPPQYPGWQIEVRPSSSGS